MFDASFYIDGRVAKYVYDFFVMPNIFFREAPDVLLQKTVVEDNRYEGLDKKDRSKVGLHVRILSKICS